MKSKLSWVAASALRFAAEQADLIPDDDLDTVIELALSAINDVASGTRLDSPVFSPQMYLSARGLLAALAARLPATHARKLLEMLADSVAVKEHHYRHTDESHVGIAAGIARAHSSELRTIAVEQLVGLYARGAHPFRAAARDVLVANLDQVRDRLNEMADRGHREAAALLGYSDPDHVSPEAAEAAAQRIREPTKNGPNRIGTGTGAVNEPVAAPGTRLSRDEVIALQTAMTDQDRADDADVLNRSAIRWLGVYEHPIWLDDALSNCQRRLLINSPWITQSVVDAQWVSRVEELARTVDVTIFWGFGDNGKTDPTATAGLHAAAQRSRRLVIVKVDDTHAKVLVGDDFYIKPASTGCLFVAPDHANTARRKAISSRTSCSLTVLTTNT
ncbi:hypothetical protein [Mycobacterium riyadhense]|uniref:hypothetical protein n=1 Tax=Mycobacterium riyadhense TaxID=486698 RepID=UPI001EF9E47C|nr:hypothetical protein [Mycobacterium riyadhense]